MDEVDIVKPLQFESCRGNDVENISDSFDEGFSLETSAIRTYLSVHHLIYIFILRATAKL